MTTKGHGNDDKWVADVGKWSGNEGKWDGNDQLSLDVRLVGGRVLLDRPAAVLVYGPVDLRHETDGFGECGHNMLVMLYVIER